VTWALGLVSLIAVPGQIAPGHVSDRIGREWVWMIGNLGFLLVAGFQADRIGLQGPGIADFGAIA
jgi:hypothetical protein